tara:strand:- start:265 stop:513 length:249 start_codon:yes stop_codon:yes gene_type:complete
MFMAAGQRPESRQASVDQMESDFVCAYSEVQILLPQPGRSYQHRYPFGWRFFVAWIPPVQGSPQGHQQVVLEDHRAFHGAIF